MNRYPVWKYAIIVVLLLIAVVYTLPNFFGEAPAVQVSSSKSATKIDSTTVARVQQALIEAGVVADAVALDGNSVKARFGDTETQLKAKDAVQKALSTDGGDSPYIVALNLLSRSPAWLTALHAAPMYLGLDLRGGVHFMLQVDMQAALTKKTESLAGDLRLTLRDKSVRHSGINRTAQAIEIRFRDAQTLAAAKALIQDQFPDLQTTDVPDGVEYRLTASIKQEAARRIQDQALKQNMVTLHNRINELGVAEPVIQQQGIDRIVVQLPGVQDTAKAKDILGRTATLEMRLVEDGAEARAAENNSGPVPFGTERFLERNGQAVIVKKQVILTGENLTDAQPGFDSQNQQPKVDLTVDAKGGRIMRDTSRENIKKRMAILLFEKGKGEVLTAPVIQQQGLDRIVVQLPGVQDTAKAKDILGRTATLEMRLVEDGAEARAAENNTGPVPFGTERFLERNGQAVIVKKQVILTGENLTDAQPGFDSQNQQPKVDLTVDAKGGRIMRDTSRENIKKRMAILLFEKGKGEVLTAPVIQSELGNRFQISGSMSVSEANDLALLLRAGSLAAPMEIIEERTIGPTLGADNISKGFQSVTWGFIVIVCFMAIYYMLFGLFSGLALAVNLLLLVAVLSMLQATLTLPGMAAMALALGMAIDSNVLINERVREELRNGASAQAAINTGYERAWATILDSNITTLIAGLALLAFGSGPVRGFAVVHCIGILTSMFSAVFFSRGLVNLWYGRQKKLKTVSIGTIWRPAESTAVAKS